MHSLLTLFPVKATNNPAVESVRTDAGGKLTTAVAVDGVVFRAYVIKNWMVSV
jgi:hypothetical protein